MGQAETDNMLSPAGFWSRRSRLAVAGLYVKGLAFLGLFLLLFLVYAQVFMPTFHPKGSFPWVSCALLLVLAVFAEAYTIRIGPGMEVSAGFLVFFLAGAIVGPLACFAIAVLSQFPELRRREWERTLSFSASFGISAGGASLVYWAILSQHRRV